LNILWDFDGTLFDTYPAYTRVFSQLLGDEADEQEIYDKLKISFSHAIEFYKLSAEQADEMERLRKMLSPVDMKPFAGVEEVLKFADSNVIMTHKDRDGVLAILDHYDWTHYFADIVTIDDGFPRKPHSAAYQHLHTKNKIDLAIGDRDLDLLPAKELGIATCMFQGESDIADYHLSDYADFFQLDLPFKTE
jgi:HAD superfamily hydrolase (TIGR01549 family)